MATKKSRQRRRAVDPARHCALGLLEELSDLLTTASSETVAARGARVSADGVRGRLAFVSELLARAARLSTAADVVTARWQRVDGAARRE